MHQRPIDGWHGLADPEPAVALPTTTDVMAPPRFASEALFAAQSHRLVGALTLFTGDAAEAEDLAQEAFVRVHASRSRLRDSDRAVSYLYSVAFNLARSRWRRQASLGRALRRLDRCDDAGPDVSAVIAERDKAATTLAVVTALPERQRACVLLHYYGELTVAETAETLGISTNSVKTHLQRGLAAMRAPFGVPDGS